MQIKNVMRGMFVVLLFAFSVMAQTKALPGTSGYKDTVACACCNQASADAKSCCKESECCKDGKCCDAKDGKTACTKDCCKDMAKGKSCCKDGKCEMAKADKPCCGTQCKMNRAS